MNDASWMLPSSMESVFMRLKGSGFHCVCAREWCRLGAWWSLLWMHPFKKSEPS